MSELLDRVRRGESVLITDRGRPIARLIPVAADRGELEGWLRGMERDGILRRQVTPLEDAFLTEDPPKAQGSVIEALLRDRQEGR